MILLYLCLVGSAALFVRPSLSHGLTCCSKTQFYMCRKACLKLETSDHGSVKINMMLQQCPSSQVSFWKCMNTTLVKRKSRSVEYFHGICCHLAVTSKCSVACHSLSVKEKVAEFCAAKQDLTLQKCINKLDMFESCCSATRISACRNACHEVIRSNGAPSLQLVSSLHNACQESPLVLQCIGSFTGQMDQLSANNYSRCCKEGKSAECRSKCNFAFSQRVSEGKLVKLLVQDCGYPMPQVGLYQCLFEVISQKVKSEEQSMQESIRDPNIFRSQCCSRAISVACQKWCKKVFSRLSVVGRADPMYVQCMENPAEYGFSTCIEDVLEPCRYGCKDKLLFCSNFNNRPLELFRRCDIKADKAAEKIYNSWKKGRFSFLSVEVPLKDVTNCSPKVWKALACSMVIKPCSRKTNRNQICRSDCVSLLSKCMDFGKDNSKSAEELCLMLLPNTEQSDCISADKYVSAKNPVIENRVTFPCQSNPCRSDEVCSINEECSFGKQSPNCRMYKCKAGCSVGTSNNIKIRNGDLAKVPLSTGNGECYGICQCLASTKRYENTYALTNCIDFGCNQRRSCIVNEDVKDHKTSFKIACNHCTCFDGELLCTKRDCELSQSNSTTDRARRNEKDSQAFSCRCNEIFNPICGFNGITYHNLCHARCTGLTDDQLRPGDCRSIEPCNPDPCPLTMKCLVHKRVCLLPNFVCPQYDCVQSKDSENKNDLCEGTDERISCGISPTPSTCCKESCKGKFKTRPVCGLDGVTYRHHCDAMKHLVPVDYLGHCSKLPNQVLKKRCERVICPDIKDEHCNKHVPVGGCCPICEPLLRILYSHKEVIRHIRRITSKPIAVKDIVQLLSNHIYVSECTLRGYLSLDGDIIIIIKSNLEDRDRIQKEICEREADKLAGMINERSPLLTTNYYLSIGKAAFVQYPSVSQSNGESQTRQASLRILIMTLIIFAFSLIL